MLTIETEDAVGNRVTAGERDPDGMITRNANDCQVLTPTLVMDPNRNRVEARFDALGLVAATAVMGKAQEPLGDLITGNLSPDLGRQDLDDFLAEPAGQAAGLLADASTRIVYDPLRFYRTQLANPADPAKWEAPFAATLARETHFHDPLPPGGLNVQVSISYSDGFGREIQKKIQAEPGPVPPSRRHWKSHPGRRWTT